MFYIFEPFFISHSIPGKTLAYFVPKNRLELKFPFNLFYIFYGSCCYDLYPQSYDNLLKFFPNPYSWWYNLAIPQIKQGQ